MPVVEINDLAKVGQINDIAPYMLPPEAWTLAENIRYSKGSPQVLDGWAQVFGTPTVAPHFAMSVKGSAQTWWLYASLTALAVYDGVTHTNVSRVAGGAYVTNTTDQWNGVVFGGIPIFNNGMDIPQAWIGAYATTLKFVNLPNWPSGMRANILRNFGSYLVAFNVTDPLTTGADGGHIFPHLVQWSNPAAPGSVPTSWAYGNPTVEGGRKDLPDTNSGIILDALQLGSTMFIYKERSVWKMNYIGGQFIYQFDTFLADVGLLAPRCVCMDITGTRHVMVTQDDIIVHNGNTTDSVLTDRQRITLFGTINRDAVNASFMFCNKSKDEIWFCYPESGQLQASRALIWNAKGGKGAISFATGINFRNAVVGDLQGVNTELWSDGTDTWDDETGPWSQIFKQKLVLCAPDPVRDLTYTNFRFYQLDSGTSRDIGPPATPVLAREDLGIVGQKRDGSLINDFKQMKLVDSVWPKLNGAPIRLRVGFREVVGGPLTWQDYTTFNPATDLWVNTIVNENLPGCGKAVSIEFSSSDLTAWRLDGYSMNIEVIGPY
jgi:hypothetical protein